jgi:dolichol-phosphate mannosyltransferase
MDEIKPSQEASNLAFGTFSVSVVIPCFNEEESLSELVRRTVAAASSAVADKYEIILIDDGSTDRTWPLIDRFVLEDRHIVGVRLSRNHGHQLALSAGLSVARGNLALVLDADLQDPPELLGPMLELMRQQSADVVYGQRRRRSGEKGIKIGTAAIFYRLLAWITDVAIPVDTGDFRLMNRRITDLLVNMPERDRFIRGMVAWLGFKQVPYLYDRDVRYAGTTKYPLMKMFRFATDAFLGHSMILLRVAAVLALTLLVSLALLSAYSVYGWLSHETAPGWTSTTILIIAIGACQLLVLSILGEYIGRIYLEGKSRPLFIIDRVRRSDTSHQDNLS